MLCFNYTVGLPWSVPVLSRLLSVEPTRTARKPAASHCTPLPGCGQLRTGPSHQPVRATAPATSLTAPQRLHTTARPTQPSEPILFPKLRIQFADFPYLHCSIDQRLFTLETCCGYGYGLARKSLCLARIFKGRRQRTGHRKNRGALRTLTSLSPAKPIPGTRALTKKR